LTPLSSYFFGQCNIFQRSLQKSKVQYHLDEEGTAKLDNTMKKVKEQIPQAMKVIETEFRTILGVKSNKLF